MLYYKFRVIFFPNLQNFTSFWLPSQQVLKWCTPQLPQLPQPPPLVKHSLEAEEKNSLTKTSNYFLCLLSNHANLNSTFRVDRYLGNFSVHTVCCCAGDIAALQSSQLWHRHAYIVLCWGVVGWKKCTAAIYGPRDDSIWVGLCLTHAP